MSKATRHIEAALAAALLLAPLGFVHAGNAAASSQPNILLIVADDMGYADAGFHGCKDIPTPHLDALAASGVRFSNGYVSGPYCSPTRAGLMTGRYQERFGHEFNPTGDQGLPLGEKTLADPQRRTYNAMMLAMDEAIGLVRKAVADAGLEQNTLVAFISDNGGPTMPSTTVNGSRNDPLRGSKRTTLEGGIRVPFIVSWPGRVKPAVFHHPAIQLDLHVTALAAAGVDVKPEWRLDGVNLLPLLGGDQSGAPHDALYWRFGEQMAIRAGDYKLVRYDTNADTRTGRPNQPVTAPKLYNLADDIGETKDLAAAMPDKLKELQSKWDAWNATLVPPLWGGGKAGRDRPKAGAPARKNKRGKASNR